MRTKKYTDRERIAGRRDIRKLFVIVSEGTKTEKTYFDDLAADERFNHPSVHVETIQPEDSSPDHVLARLTEFNNEYELRVDDELWLVIDRDRWKVPMLQRVTQQAIQKGFCVADSNPAFELWLLLHHRSLDDYTCEELTELEANGKSGSRTRLELELISVVGSYNKSRLKTSCYLPNVDDAIANARESDINESERWLNQIGSRVYLLAERIINATSPHNPLN
ncbi:MAG: RloB family protein [Chloroflexi bacterium]|nr:RloB family protein [Chloroflexota bacterium]